MSALPETITFLGSPVINQYFTERQSQLLHLALVRFHIIQRFVWQRAAANSGADYFPAKDLVIGNLELLQWIETLKEYERLCGEVWKAARAEDQDVPLGDWKFARRALTVLSEGVRGERALLDWETLEFEKEKKGLASLENWQWLMGEPEEELALEGSQGAQRGDKQSPLWMVLGGISVVVLCAWRVWGFV
ncbi:hypothetical protein EDC01DRAFT_635394 [Geopyxis carbonaria]|nr:hypothetical protein EDC01DRAFT_635394 [Geopyxis carbonaria]